MNKLRNFINTRANDEGLYDSNEVDNLEKEIRADVIKEVYNRIDEGMCVFCEHDVMEEKCYKNCQEEVELIKKWLKEQSNE